jgi:hypothetical protein
MAKTTRRKKAAAKAPDPEAFDRLRAEVKAWYRAEAERLAGAFAKSGEVDKLDFAELVRRSQALLACEMIELVEPPAEEAGPTMDEADYGQLERVAKAMAAQGKEVPESIAAALRASRGRHS